jgi:hypothetical protein
MELQDNTNNNELIHGEKKTGKYNYPVRQLLSLRYNVLEIHVRLVSLSYFLASSAIFQNA